LVKIGGGNYEVDTARVGHFLATEKGGGVLQAYTKGKEPVKGCEILTQT